MIEMENKGLRASPLEFEILACQQTLELLSRSMIDEYRALLKIINPDSFSLKDDRTPVTEIDVALEKVAKDFILSRHPQHSFLGEESGSAKTASKFGWIVDPIDGTKSLISGGFDFGTVIGVLYEGKPILGAIALPLTDQIILGDGTTTTANGHRVSARKIDSLANAVCLITDITLPEKFQNKAGFENLVKSVRLVRTWGNCYGYALLATGKADIMIDPIVSPWDIAGIIPIMRGAGMLVSDYAGAPIGKELPRSLVAANVIIHADVIKLLNPKD